VAVDWNLENDIRITRFAHVSWFFFRRLSESYFRLQSHRNWIKRCTYSFELAVTEPAFSSFQMFGITDQPLVSILGRARSRCPASGRVAHHYSGSCFPLSFSQYWTQKGVPGWSIRRPASVCDIF